MRISVVFSCLLLLACSACAQNQTTYSGNSYRNPAIGLTIEKPDSWLFVSEQQSRQNRHNMRMQDEELEREVRSQANLPTVSIAKYREPHPTINPTVQVKHLIKPSPELESQIMLEAAVEQMQRGFEDFVVTEPIEVTTLSGQEAAKMEASFTMQTAGGGAFAVRSRMWVVERGDELFIIGMSGPGEGVDASEQEFEAILSSIKIEE